MLGVKADGFHGCIMFVPGSHFIHGLKGEK